NSTNIYNFYKGMVQCFNYAIIKGYTSIEITPHLDDGSVGGNQWRNAVVMNPLRKYDGTYSYYDVMIKPLVMAIRDATKTTDLVKIYFSLEGEMNLMLISFPEKWLKLIKTVKCMLSKNTKVGVSVNFNKLCGYNFCDEKSLQNFDIIAIKNLFTSIDFLGMSSYPSVTNLSNLNSFQNGIHSLSDELSYFDINIKTLRDTGIEIHFSEFGIGGATCAGNGYPAINPLDAMQCPYFGVFGSYDISTDPWNEPHMKRFQTIYYTQFVRWIANGTGPDYIVDEVFLWNVASWDVTGIYHDSSTLSGTYRNDDVSTIIKNFNDKAIVP
ncbi:hypothetical protein EBU71_23565, partial [bacterium]|nr:hypothetical protein [Candidatus Elulimicrobium humile]